MDTETNTADKRVDKEFWNTKCRAENTMPVKH